MKQIFIPFLVALVFIGVAIWVVRSSFFEVLEIQIIGNKDIFPETSFFVRKRNLLFLSTSSIAYEIQNAYPLVQKVAIKKQFPNTLKIDITEREPLFMYTTPETIYLLDHEGYVIPNLSRLQNKRYIYLICNTGIIETRLTDASLISLLEFTGKLIKNREFEVRELVCPEKNTAFIKTDQTKIKVMVPVAKPETLANTLQFLFKQFRIEGKYPDVVDLRFEKPVLF